MKIVKIDYKLMKIGHNLWNCLQTGDFGKLFQRLVKFGENCEIFMKIGGTC